MYFMMGKPQKLTSSCHDDSYAAANRTAAISGFLRKFFDRHLLAGTFVHVLRS